MNVAGIPGRRNSRISGIGETCLDAALRGPQGALIAKREVSVQLAEYEESPPYSVVAVGLDGVTGSALIGPLLEQLTRESSVHVVATLPLRSDGRRRERRATEGLRAILKSDASASITELEVVLSKTRPLSTYGAFLRGIDRRLAGAVVRAMAF